MLRKFIFFDLGNVLLRFSVDVMLGRGSAVLGCSADELYRVIYEDGWGCRLEMGLVTEREFFDTVCGKFGADLDFVQLAEAFNDIFVEMDFIYPFLENLSSSGFPRGILSNTSSGHWNHVISKYSYLTKWIPENHVLSFRVGAMKPDKAIFEYAMNTAQKAVGKNVNLNAGDILFIDDLKQNIEGAANFGFDTIQFTDWQYVEKELKKRSLK
ncbi:MAG: HAD family phosphatase [Planctomycetaceae bacterium]|jgi:FMN phosphatase YigB (HAD superfamily)|nr:HAD family phosphatase [Planctomycetaceae bacterium]